MKHIVCFSKGHSSAIVAIEVVRKYGKDNVVLLNHDISADSEEADVKRFGFEVADYLGLPITYANIDGIIDPTQLPDQFDVCMDAGAFKVPGTGHALCTFYLKTEPFDKFLTTEYPRQDVIIYYGYDRTPKEIARRARREGALGLLGYDTAFVLIDTPDTERTIFNTMEVGIQPPISYSQFIHANCVGCLKGGIQHWYVVFCTRPDRWNKALLTEAKLGYSILTREYKGEDGSRKLRPFYLTEAAVIFARMQAAGVPPSEHYPNGKFKKYLKQYGVEEWALFVPCECIV